MPCLFACLPAWCVPCTPPTQEYQRLELQSRRQRQPPSSSYGGFWGGRGRGRGARSGKPLWLLLQEALLSERDLQMISSERLQCAQLLYRWVAGVSCCWCPAFKGG